MGSHYLKKKKGWQLLYDDVCTDGFVPFLVSRFGYESQALSTNPEGVKPCRFASGARESRFLDPSSVFVGTGRVRLIL